MKVFRSQVVSSFCEKPWKKQCAGSIRKEGVTRDETGRWPRRLEDWVEADNPVRAIEAYIETLDLSSLGFDRTQPNRTAAGQPAYAPADILKLYLYGYLNRVRSSRGLARECQRNLEVIWLLKGLRPTYKTIADFRMRNAQALPKVHTGFIAVCKDLKWLGGEQVAVDGSHKQRYAASSNDCRACPLKDRCLPPKSRRREVWRNGHQVLLEAHRQRIAANPGIMRKRSVVVEYPFGTLKYRAGWNHFLLRGLTKVCGEWSLMALAYNVTRVLNVLGFVCYWFWVISH